MKEEAKPAVNGAMPDKLIADILDTVEAREIIKVFRLLRQIRLELPQPRDRLNSVWFDPDCLVKVDGRAGARTRGSSSDTCGDPIGSAKRPPSCASTAPAPCPSTARSSAST